MQLSVRIISPLLPRPAGLGFYLGREQNSRNSNLTVDWIFSSRHLSRKTETNFQKERELNGKESAAAPVKLEMKDVSPTDKLLELFSTLAWNRILDSFREKMEENKEINWNLPAMCNLHKCNLSVKTSTNHQQFLAMQFVQNCPTVRPRFEDWNRQSLRNDESIKSRL